MPDEVLPRHDPSTGFHDIKPAPAFDPPLPLPGWMIGFIAAALIGLLILRRFAANGGKKARIDPISPLIRLEKELTRLEEEKSSGIIELREFGGRLSSALRAYLESQLATPRTPFPALDCTVPEVLTLLPGVLRQAAQRSGRPLGASGDMSGIVAPVGRILQRAERLTFADNRSLDHGLSVQLGPDELIAEVRRVAKAVEDLIRPAVPETTTKKNSQLSGQKK